MRPDVAGVVNVEQAAAWDGDEGDRWTKHEERYNASARRHSGTLLDAAQIARHDQVLDIGCGCGETTRDAARIAIEGAALGLDLSARMLARAREHSREEGLDNARFEQADVQVYPLERAAYDLAISRFGAMFFSDPVAAFTNIRQSLHSGGRLALLAWQALERNEWLCALRAALAVGRTLPGPPAGAPGPFGLADRDVVHSILTRAGFERIELREVNQPFTLGANADDAFGFVRTLGVTRGLLEGLNGADRERALDAVRNVLAAHDTGQGVLFGSCAWLITARRP